MIEHGVHIMPGEVLMQSLLVAGIICMALFAISFLRRRRLSLHEYLAWGLLAILLPAAGPFIIIWFRPGKSNR